MLCYIVNKYKDESSIEHFQTLQDLQVKIRQTLVSHEPISALKAYLSVKNNQENWNRVAPPLNIIDNPINHKTVISLIELIKKMDELLTKT